VVGIIYNVSLKYNSGEARRYDLVFLMLIEKKFVQFLIKFFLIDHILLINKKRSKGLTMAMWVIIGQNGVKIVFCYYRLFHRFGQVYLGSTLLQWFGFRLEPIFTTFLTNSKNNVCFRCGQNRL